MCNDDAWRVSMHGGHSRQFCDHADDNLEALLEAAIAFGYRSYGVAEHAPRVEAHRLYDEEREMGWTVETLDRLFEEYAQTLDRLIPRYADRITVFKGFETEVVPEDRYVEVMQGYRARLGFEYIVGSVHWVAGHIIDYRMSDFEAAVSACGDLEALAIRYYETVAEMVQALRPEVIGHFDLIRKCAPDEASVNTPRIREAAFAALDTVNAMGGVLDVNTAAYAKGLGRPYPAPWVVKAARERGISFTFGDDAHRVTGVGSGIEDARQYLLDLGVTEVAVPRHTPTGLGWEAAPLA